MAIINAGILGGFSGKLENVVGYNRLGKSIITALPSDANKILNPYIELKNKYSSITKRQLKTISDLNRNRFFLYSIAIEDINTRLYNIQNSWPKKKNVPHSFPSLFSITKPILTGKTAYTFNLTTETITVKWSYIGQPAGMGGVRYCYTYFQNASTNGNFGFSIQTQNSRDGQAIYTGAKFKAGDYVLMSTGWIDSNIASPLIVTAVPSQLILL